MATVDSAWVSVGTGDCSGNDVAQTTTSSVPDPQYCYAGGSAQSAVCWTNRSPYGAWCTYKTTPSGSCTGGNAPGNLYRCANTVAPALPPVGAPVAPPQAAPIAKAPSSSYVPAQIPTAAPFSAHSPATAPRAVPVGSPSLPPAIVRPAAPPVAGFGTNQPSMIAVWGNNAQGQIGNDSFVGHYSQVILWPTLVNSTTLTSLNITQVVTGFERVVVLTANGSVWAWGRNLPKHPEPYLAINFPVAKLFSGPNHQFAVGFDGSAVGWGQNQYGELENGMTNPYESSTPLQVQLSDIRTRWR